jgi:hypothetical protein
MSVITSALGASLSAGAGVVLTVLGVAGIVSAESGADASELVNAMGKLVGGVSALGVMLYFLADYKKRAEELTKALADLNMKRAEELKAEAEKSFEVLRGTTVAMQQLANGLTESAVATRENSIIHKQLMERLTK